MPSLIFELTLFSILLSFIWIGGLSVHVPCFLMILSVLLGETSRNFVEFCLVNSQTFYQLVLVQLLLVVFAAFVLVIIFYYCREIVKQLDKIFWRIINLIKFSYCNFLFLRFMKSFSFQVLNLNQNNYVIFWHPKLFLCHFLFWLNSNTKTKYFTRYIFVH